MVSFRANEEWDFPHDNMIKRGKYIFFYYGIVQEEIEEYYTFEETKTHRIYLPCAHTHTHWTQILLMIHYIYV